jgi:hypothetical protein
MKTVGGRRKLQSIVLLYNDRDRATVLTINRLLTERLKGASVAFWMASENLTAWGDIFEQIEDAISAAAGTIVFLGQLGLGRFQRNIELGAVNTEVWQQGAAYGRLLVHLVPGIEVPRPLLRWPTVNHDGTLHGEYALAEGIAGRFGFDLEPRRISP